MAATRAEMLPLGTFLNLKRLAPHILALAWQRPSRDNFILVEAHWCYIHTCTHLHEISFIVIFSWNTAIVDDPLISSFALTTITPIVTIAPGTVHKRLLTEGDKLICLGVWRGKRGRREKEKGDRSGRRGEARKGREEWHT